MSQATPNTRTNGPTGFRLSATDAFFVAYQERSGILMQLGGEVDLEGTLERQHLEQMILYIVARWPQLGQAIRKSLLGLKWNGIPQVQKMLRVANAGNGVLTEWRNEPIDPFHDPPFQILWIPPPDTNGGGDSASNGGYSTVAFRAHHSVMDGESFVAVTVDATNFLTQVSSGKPTPAPIPAGTTTLTNLISVRQLLRRRSFGDMWRYTRWLAAEARSGRSARLEGDRFTTGDTHICERRLDAESFTRLKRRAEELRSAPIWLCAAAWVRAIHAWNVSHGAPANPIISLEFPVSLRRGGTRNGHDSTGNFISPLVVLGDATQTLKQLARELKKQLVHGIRRQSHLGVPLMTAPGKFLPWSVFRRVAVNPRTTGFATSHFTWFEQADVSGDIARLSEGALRVTGQRIYTPVCLHMGAALAVLASPSYAQIFLTYRDTAFSSSAAEQLVNLLVAELESD